MAHPMRRIVERQHRGVAIGNQNRSIHSARRVNNVARSQLKSATAAVVTKERREAETAATPLPPPPAAAAASAAADVASTSTSSSFSPAAQPARTAQAVAAFAALAAAALATHAALSAAPPGGLPPLSSVLSGAAGAAGAAAGAAAGTGAVGLAAAKLALGDRLRVELHRGRLYVQLLPAAAAGALTPLAPGAVVVRPASDPRMGNGAFAAAPIPAGTLIGTYSGDRLDRAAFFARYPDGKGDYATAIDDEFVIDAARFVADTSRFHPVHINHTRARANVIRVYARREGRVSYVALRDIAPGEELFYDYGRAYWRTREAEEL